MSKRKVTKVSGGNIVREWMGLEFKSDKLTTWSIMAAAVTGLPSKLLPVGIDQPAGQGGWRRGRLRRRVRRLEATFPFPFPQRHRHQAPLPAAPAAVVSQRPREPAAQPLLKAAGWVQTSRCPHLQGGRQTRQGKADKADKVPDKTDKVPHKVLNIGDEQGSKAT